MTVRMIARTVHLLVAATIGIATLPARDAAAQPRSAAEDFFGVNIQTLVYNLPDRLPQHLDAVREAGIQTVRFDAAWAAVEANAPVDGVHRYDWSRFDRIMFELAERELRWLPIVDYSTRWSASRPGDFRSPPADIGAYADYAGALAARYGRGGSFWREHPDLPPLPVLRYEIWNEPNYQSTAFPADRYADAYLEARAAILRADPEAQAWVGGLAPVRATEFLREMIHHRPDIRRTIDGVGLHPYASKPGGVFGYVAELREAMDGLRLVDVPIAVTEIGWATQGRQTVPHASDEERAIYYSAITDVLARSDCGVSALHPHTWVTLERNPFNAGDWFGIVRPDGRSTATSRAYAGAIAKAKENRERPASVALCDRQPAVSVSSRHRSSRAVRRARGASAARRARGGSARRYRARTCQRATVTLGRVPLGATDVRFTYRDRRGDVERSVVQQANGEGVARDCVIKPRRRRRALRWQVEVSASRADLAHVATADARVIVR